MIRVERSALSSYASGLLAAGRGVFSADEAQKEIGISRGAFLDAAERLQRRGQLIRPRRGFYVVVPPQYHDGSAAARVVHRRSDAPRKTALLCRAAQGGGTPRRLPSGRHGVSGRHGQTPARNRGRTDRASSSISARTWRPVSSGIEGRKTQSGSMKLSSAELTALDLVRYPHSGGGLDNIATVLSELAERLNRKSSPPCRALSREQSCSGLGICSEGWGIRRSRNRCSRRCRRAGRSVGRTRSQTGRRSRFVAAAIRTR